MIDLHLMKQLKFQYNIKLCKRLNRAIALFMDVSGDINKWILFCFIYSWNILTKKRLQSFPLIHTHKINVNKIVLDNNCCAKIIFNIVQGNY